MNNVQVIILAAGKSKRMKSENPKALAIFKGKPLLRHVLDTILSLDLPNKPIIVVGHQKEKIQEVIGENHRYTEQTEQLGTGHAVMSAKKAILDKNHKTVFIISTDQPSISKETIESILVKHLEKNPTITIGTVVVPDFNDWKNGMNNFGRIIRGSDGLVKKIIEFKDATDEEKNIKEVNLALYAFDSEWLWKNIEKIENKNSQGEYYLTDLIRLACEQNKNIEAVLVYNIIEGLQPNTQEELEILEKYAT